MTVNVGDIVHVRGTVIAYESRGFRVEFECPPWQMYAPHELIVHVEPRPLRVGDRVRCKNGTWIGEIVAIRDEWAWVKWPKQFHTEMLANLERVTDEAKE